MSHEANLSLNFSLVNPFVNCYTVENIHSQYSIYKYIHLKRPTTKEKDSKQINKQKQHSGSSWRKRFLLIAIPCVDQKVWHQQCEWLNVFNTNFDRIHTFFFFYIENKVQRECFGLTKITPIYVAKIFFASHKTYSKKKRNSKIRSTQRYWSESFFLVFFF